MKSLHWLAHCCEHQKLSYLCKAWGGLRKLACGLLGMQISHHSIADGGCTHWSSQTFQRRTRGGIFLRAWSCWVRSRNQFVSCWDRSPGRYQLAAWLVSLKMNFWDLGHLAGSCWDKPQSSQTFSIGLRWKSHTILTSYLRFRLHTSFAWFDVELPLPWIILSVTRQRYQNQC